ncbi:hypothetical protein EB093_06770 [bacterium]|nr:hypothetical protein [bacterium]
MSLWRYLSVPNSEKITAYEGHTRYDVVAYPIPSAPPFEEVQDLFFPVHESVPTRREQLDRAIVQRPADPQLRYQSALTYFGEKEYAMALVEIDHCIRLIPTATSQRQVRELFKIEIQLCHDLGVVPVDSRAHRVDMALAAVTDQLAQRELLDSSNVFGTYDTGYVRAYADLLRIRLYDSIGRSPDLIVKDATGALSQLLTLAHNQASRLSADQLKSLLNLVAEAIGLAASRKSAAPPEDIQSMTRLGPELRRFFRAVTVAEPDHAGRIADAIAPAIRLMWPGDRGRQIVEGLQVSPPSGSCCAVS